MNNKLNSIPSVGTEVENSTNVEVPFVNPNDAKPFVGCGAFLSSEIINTINKTVSELNELLSHKEISNIDNVGSFFVLNNKVNFVFDKYFLSRLLMP
jgi:hypothetical protein